MRFIPMMFAAVLVVPVMSTAQTPDAVPDWPLTPGLRVRVLSPALGWRPKTGNVVSATSDTLVFLPAKQSASTAISTPKISRIEVAQGKRTHKLQGALLGLFVGAGVGAIWASASYKPPKCAPDVWCIDILGQGGETAGGGVLGGLLGMITGIIVGNHETDNWVPVAVPAPTVAVK
jgi:hypothetical protein